MSDWDDDFDEYDEDDSDWESDNDDLDDDHDDEWDDDSDDDDEDEWDDDSDEEDSDEWDDDSDDDDDDEWDDDSDEEDDDEWDDDSDEEDDDEWVDDEVVISVLGKKTDEENSKSRECGIDWNRNGEYDLYDSSIDYEIYKEMENKGSYGSNSNGRLYTDEKSSNTSYANPSDQQNLFRKEDQNIIDQSSDPDQYKYEMDGRDIASMILLVLGFFLLWLFLIH